MKKLQDLFNKYNIILSETQTKQFDLFFNNLVETNKLFNLTAITEENEVAIKHFLDSALPHTIFSQNAKVIDVGSGAGFPAIPLKIVRPDLDICMIDSLNKRINFLQECIKLLDLNKISAVHARAEEFAQKHRESFDYAIARAVAPLNTLVEYLLPLIKVGGKAVIYKSSKLEEEIVEAKNALQILGGKIETVLNFEIDEPDFDKIERKILIINKIKQTPTKYPRSANKPKTNPLK